MLISKYIYKDFVTPASLLFRRKFLIIHLAKIGENFLNLTVFEMIIDYLLSVCLLRTLYFCCAILVLCMMILLPNRRT